MTAVVRRPRTAAALATCVLAFSGCAGPGTHAPGHSAWLAHRHWLSGDLAADVRSATLLVHVDLGDFGYDFQVSERIAPPST